MLVKPRELALLWRIEGQAQLAQRDTNSLQQGKNPTIESVLTTFPPWGTVKENKSIIDIYEPLFQERGLPLDLAF